MNWGIWGRNLTPLEMATMINVCLENSIYTFDHADIYGDYTTEETFGKGLKFSGIDRTQIQLITKCGIQKISPNRPTKVKYYDYSAKHIRWSVENSLKNLRTDYLDLLLLHRPSPLIDPDEIADIIAKLKQEGKILDFGLSNFSPLQTQLIAQKTKVSFNQIEFSATAHQAMEDGSLEYMMINNIRPMAWNPLGCVFRIDTEQTQRLQELLTELEPKYGCKSETILLAWVLRHPAKIIPVAGTVNVQRIQKLMHATELTLEPQDWFAIWTESRGEKVA